MKSRFLVQVSRGLFFSLLVSGLPDRPVLAGSPASCSASDPSASACGKGGAFSAVNTNFGQDSGAALANDQATAVKSLAAVCSSCSSFTTPVDSTTGKQNPQSLFLQATPIPFVFSDVTLFQTTDPNYSTTGQWAEYMQGTSNLNSALANYGNISTTYAQYSQVYNSLVNIAVGNVMSNTDSTSTAPTAAVSANMPFSTVGGAATGFGQAVSTVYYPNGDFRPAVTNQDQAEQLLRGFIQYQFGLQSAGSSAQQDIARFFSYVILYAALGNNQYFNGSAGSYLTPTNYDMIATVFDSSGTNYSPAYSPTSAVSNLAAGTVAISGSTCAAPGGDNCVFPGGLTFNSAFSNSNAPAIVAALVSASISGTLNLPVAAAGDHSLYNLLNGVNWTQFQAAFSNPNNSNNGNLTASQVAGATAAQATGICSATSGSPVPCNSACGIDGETPCGYIIYLQGSLAQIVAGNAYYSCNVDPENGDGLDASLYYADPSAISTGQVSLASQVNTDLTAALGSAPDANFMNGINTTISGIGGTAATTFGYNTGKFYYWVPDSFTPAGRTISLDGPGVSLNNPVQPGTGPGTNWYAVCMNPNKPTSSTQLYKATSSLLKLIQPLVAKATCSALSPANGAPGCTGTTIQDAQYNLLNAIQSVLAVSPVTALMAESSKLNTLLQPFSGTFQAGTQGAVQTAQAIAAGTMQSTDDPIIPFSMGGTNVDPNILVAGSGAAVQTFDQVLDQAGVQQTLLDISSIRKNYSTCWANVIGCANFRAGLPPAKPGMVAQMLQQLENPLTDLFLLMALPSIGQGGKWAYDKIKSLRTKPTDSNAETINKGATDVSASQSVKPQELEIRSARGMTEVITPGGRGGTTKPTGTNQPTNTDPFEDGSYDPKVYDLNNAADAREFGQLENSLKQTNMSDLIDTAKSSGNTDSLVDYLKGMEDQLKTLQAAGEDTADVLQSMNDAKAAIKEAYGDDVPSEITDVTGSL